jgi:hypothetical protein
VLDVLDRPTVYIHIGVPKTGTTYLQSVLHRNRAALRRDGLLYGGTHSSHFFASQDLRGVYFRGYADTHVRGAWNRLVKEIAGWPGTSLIDHESFAGAPRPVIERALADLDFADVHLIVTARDIARQLPAVWQERVKNGNTHSYRSFLDSVRSERGRRGTGARHFWVVQDIPSVLARWGRGLPPERVHVVTVPPPGSDRGLLWRRFAGLLDLDPDAYNSESRAANASLGAAEAAVLRRFNAEIGQLNIPWPVHANLLKHRLSTALAQRGTAAIELPEDAFGWSIEYSEKAVARLTKAGYDVVGDLAELIPRSRPTGLDPDDAPAEAQADAALAGMVNLASMVVTGRVAAHAVRRAQRGSVALRAEHVLRTHPRLARAVAAVRRPFG